MSAKPDYLQGAASLATDDPTGAAEASTTVFTPAIQHPDIPPAALYDMTQDGDRFANLPEDSQRQFTALVESSRAMPEEDKNHILAHIEKTEARQTAIQGMLDTLSAISDDPSAPPRAQVQAKGLHTLITGGFGGDQDAQQLFILSGYDTINHVLDALPDSSNSAKMLAKHTKSLIEHQVIIAAPQAAQHTFHTVAHQWQERQKANKSAADEAGKTAAAKSWVDDLDARRRAGEHVVGMGQYI